MTFNNRSFEPGTGTFFIVVAYSRDNKPQVDGVYKTQKAANKLRDIIRAGGQLSQVRVGHFSTDGKTIETI